MIKSFKNPIDVIFEKWWNNGGSTSIGDLDFPDEKRCKEAFNFCIENFPKIFDSFYNEYIEKQESIRPYIERRGITDSVTKFKCKEAFIAAIQSMIVDERYKTDLPK